uniref:Uncharacterized protein n=1 Tax=Solanum lycopersicum TaxID=4081 RepID=A0A3Q7EQM8_SOLLC
MRSRKTNKLLGAFIESEALSLAIGGRDVEHSVVVGDTSGIAPRPISLGGIVPLMHHLIPQALQSTGFSGGPGLQWEVSV